MAVLNTYFGFFHHLLSCCYYLRRLNAYKRKVEIRISNIQLSCFGFKNIRNKIIANTNVESVVLTGETYEYMVVYEKSVETLRKVLENFPDKGKIEFMDINKMKIEHVKQVKTMFATIDDFFPNLRYLTIQQCWIPANFMEQFKKFLDGNDSIVRLSLIMNQFNEEELFETVECCMDHPNLEVLQIADKLKKPEDDVGGDEEEEQPKPKKKGKGKEPPARDKGINATKLSLCKGIQIRLQQNESLKKLEIRFIVLNRKFLEAVFKAIANNKTL